MVFVFLRCQEFFYNHYLDPDHHKITGIRFLQLMYDPDS